MTAGEHAPLPTLQFPPSPTQVPTLTVLAEALEAVRTERAALGAAPGAAGSTGQYIANAPQPGAAHSAPGTSDADESSG